MTPNDTDIPPLHSWPVPIWVRLELVAASKGPTQAERMAAIDDIIRRAKAHYPKAFQPDTF